MANGACLLELDGWRGLGLHTGRQYRWLLGIGAGLITQPSRMAALCSGMAGVLSSTGNRQGGLNLIRIGTAPTRTIAARGRRRHASRITRAQERRRRCVGRQVSQENGFNIIQPTHNVQKLINKTHGDGSRANRLL